jgi:hypothetical protein
MNDDWHLQYVWDFVDVKLTEGDTLVQKHVGVGN